MSETNWLDKLDNEKIRKHDINSRISYLRVSLASLCLRGNANDISIHQFFNLSMLLLHEPLILFICEKKEVKNSRQDRNNQSFISRDFYYDPLFKKHFYNSLRDYKKLGAHITKEGTIFFTEKNVQDYVIPIFSTKYMLLIHRVQSIGRSYKELKDDLEFIPVSKNHCIGSYFEKLLQPFDRPLDYIGINHHVDKNIEDLAGNTLSNRSMNDDDVLSYKTSFVSDKAEKSFFDMLENIYNKHEGSPLLNGMVNRPRNIIFHAKWFNQQRVRFNHYLYHNQTMICEIQKDSMSSAFDKLYHIEPFEEDGHMFWLDPLSDLNEWQGGKKPCFPRLEIDNIFWKKLRENGGKFIVDKLLQELPSCTRIFNEYCFNNHTAQVQRDVFNDGLTGIIDDELEDSNIVLDEYLRLACWHYALLLMVPAAPRHEIFSYPVQISGATSITVSTVRPVFDEENPDYCNSILSDSEFQHAFLFYDVFIRLERHLRRRCKRHYIVMMDQLITKIITSVFRDEDFKPNLLEDWQALIRYIDKSLLEICRFFPYARLRITNAKPLAKDKINDKSEARMILSPYGKGEAYFWLSSNPFFRRFDNSSFVNEDRLFENLYSHINSVFARISNKNHYLSSEGS